MHAYYRMMNFMYLRQFEWITLERKYCIFSLRIIHRQVCTLKIFINWGLGGLTPLSTIFPLYRGGQLYWWRRYWLILTTFSNRFRGRGRFVFASKLTFIFIVFACNFFNFIFSRQVNLTIIIKCHWPRRTSNIFISLPTIFPIYRKTPT
jgi:hypothetical protein